MKKLKRTEHDIDTLLVDNLCLTTRTIFLNDGIDDSSLELVTKGLHLFANQPVRIILNSGGGDVASGLAICDLIELHPKKITIDVIGQAVSMAAVILQAADLRRMTASAHLMLHAGVDEPPADIKKNIKAYLKLTDEQDNICDELVLRRIQEKHPKYSWTKFREETLHDVYFTADQAVKWNLVDEIIK